MLVRPGGRRPLWQRQRDVGPVFSLALRQPMVLRQVVTTVWQWIEATDIATGQFEEAQELAGTVHVAHDEVQFLPRLLYG
jgi:hypothetical protein